jgi:hypothetical protein
MSELLILQEGDDQPCLKCGVVALDTGWECTECGYDNRPWYYPEGAKKAAEREKDDGV